MAFPPAKLLWATAPTTSYQVYLTGRQAAEAFYQLAAQHLAEVRRIYELGCGALSVLRHMPGVAEGIEAFGSDYDPKLVDWCKANVPGVKVELNALEPPLRYHDDSFDFVYSRSVFTHLSAGLQKQWLTEQFRVTRPGGLVLVTVHGDAYKHRLTRQERAEYESAGFVEHRTADDGGPWYTTFNSPAYMEQELLAGLEVVHRDLLPEEACGLRQDTWMVRKPG
jgi:SAM-dependent methyltransferase